MYTLTTHHLLENLIHLVLLAFIVAALGVWKSFSRGAFDAQKPVRFDGQFFDWWITWFVLEFIEVGYVEGFGRLGSFEDVWWLEFHALEVIGMVEEDSVDGREVIAETLLRSPARGLQFDTFLTMQRPIELELYAVAVTQIGSRYFAFLIVKSVNGTVPLRCVDGHLTSTCGRLPRPRLNPDDLPS
jgi:hypothetical protein